MLQGQEVLAGIALPDHGPEHQGRCIPDIPNPRRAAGGSRSYLRSLAFCCVTTYDVKTFSARLSIPKPYKTVRM